MTRTQDAFPGERLEESILFDSGSLLPLSPGEILYVTGAISGSGFYFNQEGIVAGPVLDAAAHRGLRQLIHFVSDGPFETFSGSFCETGPFPFATSSIWYTDATKSKKIVEQLVTYNPNKTFSKIVWNVYDIDGVTVLATSTDAITYTGIFETSRTRTIT